MGYVLDFSMAASPGRRSQHFLVRLSAQVTCWLKYLGWGKHLACTHHQSPRLQLWLPTNQSLGGSGDGLANWVPATRMGDWDGVPGSWLWLQPLWVSGE